VKWKENGANAMEENTTERVKAVNIPAQLKADTLNPSKMNGEVEDLTEDEADSGDAHLLRAASSVLLVYWLSLASVAV